MAISEANAPPLDENSSGVKLVEYKGFAPAQSVAFPAVRQRIDLYPICQAAVVYPDTRRPEEFDVVDLHSLPAWRLRLLCFAATSKGFVSGQVHVRIREVLVFSNPNGDAVVGRVVEHLGERPVSDALIKDNLGRTLAKTRANGAFVVPRSRSTGSLAIEKEGYSTNFARSPAATPIHEFVTVRLRKLEPEFGDVIDVIEYGDLHACSIGFRGGILNLLVQESDTVFRLLPVDLAGGNAALGAPGSTRLEFPDPRRGRDFVQCGNRLVGVRSWPVALLDLTSTPPSPLPELKHPRDGGRINWTAGAAFDGSVLWFIESDQINKRFGLHAVDLERGGSTNFLPGIDMYMEGLAWDGRSFWISSTKGRVYAIDRDVAVKSGTIEMGMGREFPGKYSRLAFGQGYLWGLQPENHRICKIKVTD